MALQPINYGAAPNDGTGDSLREAMRKAQANFDYLNLNKVSAEEGKSLMTEAERAKLANIQEQATKNYADAYLLDRANHTGKQPFSTVQGLETSVASRMLVATSVVDFLRQMCTLGPGYYRSLSDTPGLPPHSSGVFSILADTYTFVLSSYQTGAPLFLSGNLADLANGVYQICKPADRSFHTGPLNWAWATYGGTANTIALSPAYTRDAYAVGDEFRFRATATNTGATTINVGGLGAKNAVTVAGDPLPPGYIRTGMDTVCVYDGAQFVVQREIERGSNANGSFIRFAEGTQLCWGEVVMPNTAPQANVLWTYPAAFVSSPHIGFSTEETIDGGGNQQAPGDLMRNGVYLSKTRSSCNFNSYNYENIRFNAVLLNVSSSGRWY